MFKEKVSLANDLEYRSALASIEPLLKKGFANLSQEEDEELAKTTALIEAYESANYFLPFKPKTLVEMIQFRMFEMKLKQKDLAKLLGVTENRISEILNGKRKINLDLAKRLNANLKIDSQFILAHA